MAFASPPQPKAVRTAVAKTHQYGLEGKVATLDQTEYFYHLTKGTVNDRKGSYLPPSFGKY